MEGKEEDVRLGANRYSERQPIGTAAQGGGADEKDYKEPPPAPLFEAEELTSWSFYRAGIAEFLATFLFLYISVLTVMGVVGNPSGSKCGTVGIQGIAWSFGGMIFVLVYCTAGISGGHINPAPVAEAGIIFRCGELYEGKNYNRNPKVSTGNQNTSLDEDYMDCPSSVDNFYETDEHDKS